MLPEAVKERIAFILSEIEKDLASYELLFQAAAIRTPDIIEKTALASVLHSFYNGLEGVFTIIFKNIDKQKFSTANWHTELLKAMIAKSPIRRAVLSPETFVRVQEYLAFRHFFRHGYASQLDWAKMEPLVKGLSGVWASFRKDLDLFLESL